MEITSNPYLLLLKYSGYNNVWGNKVLKDDLSHIDNYNEFIQKLDIINKKVFDSIEVGGRHAILIGDVRRKGKYYSIIKDMEWYGELDSHLIKLQHNTRSQNKNYSNRNFIPIAHEHLLIFKK